jgi:lysosomal acid phosphatase
MASCLAFLLLLLISVSYFASTNCADHSLSLELVQIVFRHGDRTPNKVYPNDPNEPAVWDKYGGFGQLTQQGMQRHFEYGAYLRARYDGYLTKLYNINKVLILSTNFPRTLMSCASLLAGLYPPVDFQLWNQQLAWQPISIPTQGWDSVYAERCARYDTLYSKVALTSEDFYRAQDKYRV